MLSIRGRRMILAFLLRLRVLRRGYPHHPRRAFLAHFTPCVLCLKLILGAPRVSRHLHECGSLTLRAERTLEPMPGMLCPSSPTIRPNDASTHTSC